MHRTVVLVFFTLLSSFSAWSQNGVIKGRVFDPVNNEPVAFANVVIQNTTIGTITDDDGNYQITDLDPGIYNLQISFIGFQSKTIFEIAVNNAKAAIIDVALEKSATEIDEVVVKSDVFSKTVESPVSLRTIGVNEIRRYPGGNQDISKVIQSLPGVGTTVSFRNDIIIRGGAPSENTFYVDGIETPIINHFATQGASGGPVGLINVDLIRGVNFYTGAFPVNRGNVISSVMDMKWSDGRDDRIGFNFTVGASEAGFSLEGPIGKKSTFILSARRSYLQFLFKLFELPFLPTYNDFQFKNKIRFNKKNELTIIGLGSYDQFDLNLEANETEDQLYILNNIPVNGQWHYTVGLKHRLYRDNGYWDFIISRNHLNNFAYKYINNDESNEANLNFDYNSDEIESKIRIENLRRIKKFKVLYGVNYENAVYKNSSFVKNVTQAGLDTFIVSSKLNINKYGLFASTSTTFFDSRLSASLGFRVDGNDFNSEMKNPLNTFSPRASISLGITPEISFNMNAGIYFRLPPYTALGFTQEGKLLNKDLRHIRNKQLVAGFEYITKSNSKLSLEAFLKVYDRYPFLLQDSISLGNLGGDFGVIGNDPLMSVSTGKSYGTEFLFQQKLLKGFYGIVSYTLFWSRFSDKNGELIPSAWDSRHIISLTGGKKFKKNWEVGLRYRIAGGSPYTPIDQELSSMVQIWDAAQQGIPDYDLLNTERLSWFHQLDLRIDKKIYFKNFNLEIYLDIENVYNFSATLPDRLTVVRDENGLPVVDPASGGSKYQTYFIEDSAGQILPTFGLILGN
ncbi:MAG: TonB-dependent receptor [Chitinophagales bacterium]|nr:TonB-dependent receptor [Chitinophagales bacterium]